MTPLSRSGRPSAGRQAVSQSGPVGAAEKRVSGQRSAARVAPIPFPLPRQPRPPTRFALFADRGASKGPLCDTACRPAQRRLSVRQLRSHSLPGPGLRRALPSSTIAAPPTGHRRDTVPPAGSSGPPVDRFAGSRRDASGAGRAIVSRQHAPQAPESRWGDEVGPRRSANGSPEVQVAGLRTGVRSETASLSTTRNADGGIAAIPPHRASQCVGAKRARRNAGPAIGARRGRRDAGPTGCDRRAGRR